MSRLTCAAGLALAITIVAPAARGEGDVNAVPAPAARGEGPVEAAPPAPPRLRWSLGTRIGYAYAWSISSRPSTADSAWTSRTSPRRTGAPSISGTAAAAPTRPSG